eukprot:TRINITY_DN5762_c0_g1_i3.p1 TRINITY_DN5762_c0_g1~~TRINITY_DN5762_c0_g1_i3.p1  ORF type:complete len:373 (+),score=62.16 TRINITY_DN5762_c0_g1_i3:541-1659(+)
MPETNKSAHLPSLKPQKPSLLSPDPNSFPYNQYHFTKHITSHGHVDPYPMYYFINSFIGFPFLDLKYCDPTQIIFTAERPAPPAPAGLKADIDLQAMIKIKVYLDFAALGKEINDIYTMIEISNRCTHFQRVIDAKVSSDQRGRFYLYIVSELPRETLETDIARRKKKQRYYTEDEIHDLFYAIAAGLNFLHLNGVDHGLVKPSNIFISRNGQFKLGEVASSSTKPVLRVRTYGSDKSTANSENSDLEFLKENQTYLAPKIRHEVIKGNANITDHDPLKSDMFSCGITMLEAASLSDVSEIYSTESQKYKKEAMVERLNTVNQNYKKEYGQLFSKMLKVIEAERPTAGSVVKKLKKLRPPKVTVQDPKEASA